MVLFFFEYTLIMASEHTDHIQAQIKWTFDFASELLKTDCYEETGPCFRPEVVWHTNVNEVFWDLGEVVRWKRSYQQ